MPAMVVVPGGQPRRVLRVDRVEKIVANRIKENNEQYLIQWRVDSEAGQRTPLSWHSVHELSRCLEILQEYLEARSRSRRHRTLIADSSKKRKSPSDGPEHSHRSSPFERITDRNLTTSSRSSSVASTPQEPRADVVFASPSLLIDVYNGVLESQAGLLFARTASGPGIHSIDIRDIPTAEMKHMSYESKVSTAEIVIRAEYVKRLEKVPGKKIHITNIRDTTSPSLRFHYIADNVLRPGVFKVDPAAQTGCTTCSPHMGRDIGCEYTKKCECLEYAAVDKSRMDEDERLGLKKILALGGSTLGLPKKFPYFCEGSKTQRVGCLVPFYLNSRNPIYECNDRCNCGQYCRNKNVQYGRQIELEIFRTNSGRGWGLRSKDDVSQGQFIDTYRGEIITDAEATRREEGSSKAKASYLYSLDKFAESEGLADEDIYVVDGEFMGGPTKFMNHSCEPNCRQYTVSYNKHDCRVYDIAFFAIRDIPAGEELTFDYLDKDEEEDEEDEGNAKVGPPSEGAVPCLCGAAKCRKWLWT